MKHKSTSALFFLLILGYSGFAISGTTSTEENASSEEAKENVLAEETVSTEEDTSSDAGALAGNSEAGEARYKESCVNCHGTAGKGAASYPKVSGNEIAYTKEKLETYRAGTKIGPNKKQK